MFVPVCLAQLSNFLARIHLLLAIDVCIFRPPWSRGGAHTAPMARQRLGERRGAGRVSPSLGMSEEHRRLFRH
jgi:hypothetical protein